jgi:hypothetical protein
MVSDGCKPELWKGESSEEGDIFYSPTLRLAPDGPKNTYKVYSPRYWQSITGFLVTVVMHVQCIPTPEMCL